MRTDANMARLDETAGRSVLKHCFTQAGYEIIENYPLGLGVEGGQGEGAPAPAINLDGYDPKSRVGYEYITTAAGDRAEVTPALLAALESLERRGELFVLLIDEEEVSGKESLERAAFRFLSEVERRRDGAVPASPGGHS